MRSTTELIREFEIKVNRVREDQVDKLWEDFLNSVYIVFYKMNDEQIAFSSSITISYYVRGDQVYRSNIAELDNCSCTNNSIKFQENPKLIGNSYDMEDIFKRLFSKMNNDKNIVIEGEYSSSKEIEISIAFVFSGRKCS